MEIIKIILAFALTLGVLISFHEFGHFITARILGIKVVRFSIGFGKVLLRKFDKRGTEFVISAIPLGGYVAMLDDAIVEEENIELSEADKTKLFSAKPLWARFLVIFAGPAFNFILAILLFWLIFTRPYYQMSPVIGGVIADSIAEKQDLRQMDRIISINSKSIDSWQAAFMEFTTLAGENANIDLQIQRDNTVLNKNLVVQNFINAQEKNPLTFLGIKQYAPPRPAIVEKVVENSPAYLGGLKRQDEILQIGADKISDWSDLVTIVQRSPNKKLDFIVLREGREVKLSITPEGRKNTLGVLVGKIGAAVLPPVIDKQDSPYWQRVENNIFQALGLSVVKTWDMSILTLNAVGKMITGVLSLENLSGPISIAKISYQSVRMGWERFLQFLAIISISLGVFNLIPVPMLDGGQLLFLILEGVGIKLSDRAKLSANKLGFALLITLMFMAIYLDILRL